MQNIKLVLFLVGLLAASCNAYSSATITGIMPYKLSVNITFNIAGASQTPTSPCTQQAPGAACLPKPHAVRDSINISYAVKPGVTANTSDTVLLKACYSPFSQVNRPWRAPNNVIALSKACPYPIAAGLNPTSGSKVFKLPSNMTTGTYFVRALVYQKNASDPTTPYAVAIGDSTPTQGFFQVIPISHREKGLTVASGLCICVGPLLFTAFMVWEFKLKKQ